MDATQSKIDRTRMCSRLTREGGEDGVGHAFEYDGIVITEMPKPWSQDTSSARGLARVWHLKRPEGPFSAYHKDEYLLPENDAAELLEALLFQQPVRKWEGALIRNSRSFRDLLVCTHGSVDTCCATFGYPVYRKLRETAGQSRGNLRVWQATHFQYHRFAAVVLDLPEMRYWGAVDNVTAVALASRDVHPGALRQSYMGWAGVEREFAQAAEREAFIREGWKWTKYLKSAQVARSEGVEERAKVKIDFASPQEDFSGSYLADVEITNHVSGLVGCLYPGQTVTAPQYSVSSLELVT